MDRYRLFVSDSSYYSGKLEAFLRYKGIETERVEINVRTLREELLPATGMMKVPAMRCPDGAWLKDTTPMMQWLDRTHPAHSIYPEDPGTRFLALLVEDYADEWMWRPAMYYRWRFADSHILRRHRLGHELAAGFLYPAWLTGWYMRIRQYVVFVRGDGVRLSNEPAVQALYTRTLAQLSRLLATRRFLLGSRPSIVDFAFFASMFRHFALDPYPAKIMVDTAPAVFAWVARLWNARGERDGVGEIEDFDRADFDDLFAAIGREYLPYLDANAQAYASGARRFDFTLDGARYPRLPVVRYRVACRRQLLLAWAALAPAEQARVRARLERSGIDRWLATAPMVDAGLDEEFVMPLARRYPPARGLHGLRLHLGTPWDRPAPPLADPPPAPPRN